MRYRLQRHDGTDCSATMVPITVLRMVPIQRYRQKAESSRTLFKPSFSAYMEAQKSLKATEATKAMYLHRDGTEVIGKILKCRYAIVQPYSGVQQKKTASFLLSPDMEKCIGKLKSASK